MIVVDASVAIKWFVDEPDRDAARKVIESGDILVAPDIVVLETLSVLRRKQRLKLISQQQITRAVGEIRACFADLISASNIADEALKLSMELDHSIYDCSYLACAMLFDIKLITADVKFLRKVAQTRYAHHGVGLVKTD